MKNPIRALLVCCFFTLSVLAFADGNTSLISPTAFNQNNYNKRDITAQIALREAFMEINFYKLQDLYAKKIAFIEKEKLSWWDKMWDARVQEFDRQIKYYEDQNKRYEQEIRQFRKML